MESSAHGCPKNPPLLLFFYQSPPGRKTGAARKLSKNVEDIYAVRLFLGVCVFFGVLLLAISLVFLRVFCFFPMVLRFREEKILGVFEVFLGIFKKTKEKKDRVGKKGLPLPLGRGVCETKSKNGRSTPENPLFLGFSVLRAGLRPWSQSRGLGRGQTMG